MRYAPTIQDEINYRKCKMRTLPRRPVLLPLFLGLVVAVSLGAALGGWQSDIENQQRSDNYPHMHYTIVQP